MRAVLVLGGRLLASGKASREFKKRMSAAVSLLAHGKADVLVISGGMTRIGFPSEAETGLALVPENLREKVLIETRSRSTLENIRYARGFLEGLAITSLVVVTSASHVPRARFLVKKFLPEMYAHTSFEGVGRATLAERVREFMLHCLAVIDPYNRVFLPLLKKWFRSG